MDILKSLLDLCRKENKQIVVIGGHALNARGIMRSTHDLDLMVSRDDADFWITSLQCIGYSPFNRTPAFIQFKAPQVSAWPIDLMLVDSETFRKAQAQASFERYGEVEVMTASVAHLIAMKLHALKNEAADRFKKDETDLLQLLELAQVPLNSNDFRQLCEKYANLALYERLTRSE